MAFALVLVGDWKPELREGVLRIQAALEAQPATVLPSGTVNLKLVDDAEIAALNEQYTGNAYATDVLTFNYQESEPDGKLPEGELADIAISLETATRQASDAGFTLVDEVALLALHGLLHVLGHDHHTPADRQRLEQLQNDLLESAGFSKRDFSWTE